MMPNNSTGDRDMNNQSVEQQYTTENSVKSDHTNKKKKRKRVIDK